MLFKFKIYLFQVITTEKQCCGSNYTLYLDPDPDRYGDQFYFKLKKQ